MKTLVVFLCFLGFFVATVQPAEKDRNEFCYFPSQYGKCNGHRVLWYFSINQKMCVPFVFSNCGGNQNRFFTKEMCEKACAPRFSIFN
ncbi:PI-actitoxin-Axm2b [Drosophila ficusphila]|uniref:PI-actitoxin-Axm2b n=1 Tax=Drosophila ficusphila TaxID=30025 RepID=UPI0007E6212A|nr:PI-actitoxin-Axm2b [Drosophila ficusphila]